MRFIIFLALLLPAAAQAQYVQVATANQTVAIAGSVTTFARYGSVADNKWFYKAYSTKTFVVGGAEFTTNPDPGADPSTFVLQVFQIPLVSNFPPPTIAVNGKVVVVPPASTSNNVIVPPLPSTTVHFTISATCDGTTTAAICH
jgi:hypothetical protein